MGKLLCVGLTLFSISRSISSAEEDTNTVEHVGEAATIDADVVSFDRANDTAYGEGNVEVRYKDAVLRADKMRYNTVTKDVWAEGNVRLNRDGQEWVAPAAYYNFETRVLRADDMRGFVEPVYLWADHLDTETTNRLATTRATATTCDSASPHYRVEARRAVIYTRDRVVMYNVTFRLGDVPVFWFPVMTWSLKGDQPPLTLSLGQSSRWGFFVLTTTSFRLNDKVTVDLLMDQRTLRGFGSGPELSYRLDEESRGLIRGYFLSDARPEMSLDETSQKEIPTSRYRVEWQHKQFFPNNIDVTVDLEKQSDSVVIEDFFPQEFRRNSEPDSVADITKRGDNFTLSALVRPQFNDFFAVVDRLPEAKLAVNRTKLGTTPLFYESESSAGYYNNDPGDTDDPLYRGSSMRLDTFHQIVVPHMFFGWLSVVPRAGGRATFYQRTPDTAPETNGVSRLVGDLGMQASFKLSRAWTDVKSTRWRIDGLRHILEPFADYQWVPQPNVKTNDLFQFDTIRTITITNSETIPLARYLPLQFPAFNEIDAITRENVVRFGLRQTLQTRRDGAAWNLAELTGWTDWRIEQDPGEKDFNDFFGRLELRPTSWIASEASTRYDMNAGVLREINTRAHVFDGDRWSVGIGTRYLKDDSNIVSADVAWRLNRHWTVQVYQRVDLKDGEWEEQDYMLRQETHDWYINYGFRYRSQRDNPDEKAVFFSVSLKAFPNTRLGANRVDLGVGGD